MIKTVLLDLDDTIYNFQESEAESLKQAMGKIGITLNEENIRLYSRINEEQWKRLERSEITRGEVLLGRFQIFFDELGIRASAENVKDLYESFLSKSCIFVKGAKSLLEHLSSNYNLYLVSNGTATVQEKRIKKGNIAHYFDDIFISQNIGYNKPDIKYFHKCFEKIENFQNESTIIIGDSMTSDIKGGINANIHTCLYNPKNISYQMGFQSEYEVRNLEEIPKLIKEI